MKDSSKKSVGNREIESVTQEAFALTSWDLLLKLNTRYLEIVDESIASVLPEIQSNPLFDQMTKNNHVTSIAGLRQILVSDFGKKLSLLMMKESGIASDYDVKFAGFQRVFNTDQPLNKNAISNYIHCNQVGDASLRSVQGQVEKTINAMILVGFVEVDNKRSKGKMKALKGTEKFRRFSARWAVEAAKILQIPNGRKGLV